MDKACTLIPIVAFEGGNKLYIQVTNLHAKAFIFLLLVRPCSPCMLTTQIMAYWLVTSYPGSWWAGKEKALYPLFAHVLNFPEMLGYQKLLLYNHDDITYTYRYIIITFSDQQWKRFNHLFSWAVQLPPAVRYFWYESEEGTGRCRVFAGVVNTATAW